METTFDDSQSILNTVKKVCGITEDYTAFDQDLLIYINSAILELTQNGVGTSGFIVQDASIKWNEFISDKNVLGPAVAYVSQKARLMFDPPSSSFVVDAMQKQLEETIWRLNVEADKE